MKLVIVTGMSGAGKTIALKMLEDMGFYCVDNLPIPLLEPFARLAVQQPSGHERVALGIDIRSGKDLPQLLHVLEDWRQNEMPCQILYLDASDETLVKRYKETRRSHPLAGRGRVDAGIRQEREQLEFLKKKADFIIDTSQLLTRELRQGRRLRCRPMSVRAGRPMPLWKSFVICWNFSSPTMCWRARTSL